MLDALPGDVRSGEADGKDHPARVIQTLRAMPQPLASRNAVVDQLLAAGGWGSKAWWRASTVSTTHGRHDLYDLALCGTQR